MRSGVRQLLAGIGLFAAAAAARAVPTPASVPAPQSTPGRVEPAPDEAIAAAMLARAFAAEDEAQRLDLLDQALAEAPRPTRFRGSVQCIRASTLAAAKRQGEALPPAEECARLLPDNPNAALLLGTLLAGTPGSARGTMLIVGALEQQPQLVLGIPAFEADTIVRRLGYMHNADAYRRFVAALVKGGFADAHPAFAGQFVSNAIAEELAAGNRPGAVRLLTAFITPDALLPMIVGTRYRDIWSDIEAMSGGDLHAQRIASVAAAKAAFQRTPDEETRGSYADALADAGYIEDALPLLRTVIDDDKQWGEERDAFIFAVRRLSKILENADRFDDAIAVRARALAISPLKTYPEMVNVAVNQASLLANLGRSKEADALLDDAVARGATQHPDFEGVGALLWFDALHSCSADPAVAGPARRRSLAGRQVNEAAYRAGLACAGEVKALSAAVVAELDRRGDNDVLIYRLRRYQIDTRPMAQASERTWRLVAADAAVTKRLDALSRPIPPDYRAAALHWRN